MTKPEALVKVLQEKFAKDLQSIDLACGEVTIEVVNDQIVELCRTLRDDEKLAFNQLIDLCGVDYLSYGVTEWATDETATTGYSRGVELAQQQERIKAWDKPRFAVVYHLLSTKHNHRLRIRTFVDEESLMLDSVVDIWRAADWFEREAFDLYGILFNNHPDLRRILTDYGFVGHPFRKDFPLSGEVEMRYDAKQGRVIYEPVDIEPRVLVAKVIREDNRYQEPVEPDYGEHND